MMTHAVFMWMLSWHLVQNANIITSLFHVSTQRGDIPDITVECAAKCSLEEKCVGFDVSANECTLLNLPNAEPQPGHMLYLSQDRVDENVPSCYPIAARVSDGSSFYIHFSTEETIYKYSTANTTDMQLGLFESTDSLDGTYPELVGRTPNAVFRFYGDLYFIIGSMMEVYIWGTDHYGLYTDYYPRSLVDEMSDVPIPSSVNAADVNDTTLYVTQGNTVYSYSMDNYAPYIAYEFLGQFDMRENSGLNPFSAGPGSPLDRPPSWITAMVFCDNDTTLMAFSYTDIYMLSLGYWEYLGEIFTPCA